MDRQITHWVWPENGTIRPAKYSRMQKAALGSRSYFAHLRRNSLNADSCTLCPSCGRVLVDLANYDPDCAAIGVEDHTETEDYLFYNTECYDKGTYTRIFEFIDDIFKWVKAKLDKKRLNLILNDYPHSMYCAGCGHVLKRK